MALLPVVLSVKSMHNMQKSFFFVHQGNRHQMGNVSEGENVLIPDKNKVNGGCLSQTAGNQIPLHSCLLRTQQSHIPQQITHTNKNNILILF